MRVSGTMGGTRRKLPGVGVLLVGMVAVAALLLMGCASGSSVNASTPIATSNSGNQTPGANPTIPLPSVTAAPTATGPAGPSGVSEFCSKPPSVAIHPPSNIPVYPGADLHHSEASGNNSFYGFCTSNSVSTVQNFYAQQLRTSGWQGLQTSTISDIVQISAAQCSAPTPPQIIVTIAPDSVMANTTSISIVILAGTC